MLYQLSYFRKLCVGVIGFEPIQLKATDLQSAPTLRLRRTPAHSKIFKRLLEIQSFVGLSTC